MTYAKFKKDQLREEKAFFRAALQKHKWGLLATAKGLGMWPSSLRSTVRRVGLMDEYERRNPGPGRPW